MNYYSEDCVTTMLGVIKDKWIFSSVEYADPDANANEFSK